MRSILKHLFEFNPTLFRGALHQNSNPFTVSGVPSFQFSRTKKNKRIIDPLEKPFPDVQIRSNISEQLNTSKSPTHLKFSEESEANANKLSSLSSSRNDTLEPIKVSKGVSQSEPGIKPSDLKPDTPEESTKQK